MLEIIILFSTFLVAKDCFAILKYIHWSLLNYDWRVNMFQTLGVYFWLHLSILVQNQNVSYSYVVPYLAEGKTVWTVLGTFADVTSLQGVPYIKKANRWWSTLFWIIIFGIACTACLLHIGYLSMRYLDHSTSSKTDIGFTYLEFPSVTVCNMNPIRYSRLNESTTEMQNFIHQIEQTEQNAGNGDRKKVQNYFIFRLACTTWDVALRFD